MNLEFVVTLGRSLIRVMFAICILTPGLAHANFPSINLNAMIRDAFSVDILEPDLVSPSTRAYRERISGINPMEVFGLIGPLDRLDFMKAECSDFQFVSFAEFKELFLDKNGRFRSDSPGWNSIALRSVLSATSWDVDFRGRVTSLRSVVAIGSDEIDIDRVVDQKQGFFTEETIGKLVLVPGRGYEDLLQLGMPEVYIKITLHKICENGIRFYYLNGD